MFANKIIHFQQQKKYMEKSIAKKQPFFFLFQCMFVCFVCFVALRPKSTAMVIAGRSVHLTTLFPGQA